ncbi:MAG: hypothetical protein KC996_08035 [Phycisphaerales bacterium]|nr:hypothetical protein [Phycisphaerales bacterium]
MNYPATLTAFALAACATVSQAGIMQITEDSRRVRGTMVRELENNNPDTYEAWGDGEIYNGAIPNWNTMFSHSFSTAEHIITQNSTATSTQLQASGSINHQTQNPGGLYDNGISGAINEYIVRFMLAEETAFSLDIEITAATTALGDFLTYAVLESTDGGNTSVGVGDYVPGGGAEHHYDLHETFTLSAGEYRFTVFAETVDSYNNHADFSRLSTLDFSAQLNIIPAPSSLALLVAAGAPAIRRRR